MNQLPTSTDNPDVPVPSIDDVGRTSGTVAFPCRRPPHPTRRRFAVKKSRCVAGVKKSTLTSSTPEATSFGVHLFNSLGFDSKACYSFS
jgi:hypothetical protein